MTVDDFVPKSVRRLLGMCPKQELRPVRFTEWAEEYIECLKHIEGIDDAARRTQFRLIAKTNNWSKAQINAVLRDFGLTRKPKKK